jgi:hypothetical protein
MSALELLTIGRISVDLYAEQVGVPLREVRTFRKSIGGTATNVAVAAARLGHVAAVFTKVGDDPFGDYVRWALAETFGVDTSEPGDRQGQRGQCKPRRICTGTERLAAMGKILRWKHCLRTGSEVKRRAESCAGPRVTGGPGC